MYVTTQRYAKTAALPVSLTQTELRRAKSIAVTSWSLERGERMELSNLTLHVVKILTPGPLPVYTNTALGACSVGLYFGNTLTSPLAWASIGTVGVATVNPFAVYRVATPGLYTVIVSNNTSNIDLSACVTGSIRLFRA